jgi:hypothetical protein
MPDGIDTLLQGVQASDRHPMLDLIPSHPKINQLTPAHHPVLPASKLRQQPIVSASPRMTETIPVYDELAGHAWEAARKPRTRGARLVPIDGRDPRQTVTCLGG